MDARFYDHAKVAKLREDAGLTQELLADELGVTPITISRVENGHSASPDLLARIARRFGKNLADILYSHPLDARKNFSLRT
jgi:transcriptional regulator with XRE-family HTH domain